MAQEIREVASIARTTCYGQCPYYKIKIYSDGLLVYEGKKNVAHLGTHRARISVDSIDLILAQAKAINYMQLCITHIKEGLAEKTIWNRNDAPVELIRFERYIDQLLADIHWIKL